MLDFFRFIVQYSEYKLKTLLFKNATWDFSESVTSKLRRLTMGGQKKVAPSNYNTGIGIYDV